jgi:hypothetical protein
MEMVGGLDLHRSQITFRTVDLRTGEVQRGKILPGAREAMREWLDQFQPGTDAHFALEGTTGWRFVVEEIERRGFVAHLADPAELPGPCLLREGQGPHRPQPGLPVGGPQALPAGLPHPQGSRRGGHGRTRTALGFPRTQGCLRSFGEGARPAHEHDDDLLPGSRKASAARVSTPGDLQR